MDGLWALFGWPGILLPLSAVAAYAPSSSPYAGLNVLRKIRLIIIGFLHMVLSRDRKWKASKVNSLVCKGGGFPSL